jgi:hypothetical protein
VARWRIVTRLHRLACYLLKGQSRRSGCAPMTCGLPRQEDKFRARRASHLCHQETYAPQQFAAHSITSSARASCGADRETKRLCRLQIGCQPEASQEFDRQVAQCSAPLLTTAPPRHSGQGPWRQDCPKRRRCSDRAGPRRYYSDTTVGVCLTVGPRQRCRMVTTTVERDDGRRITCREPAATKRRATQVPTPSFRFLQFPPSRCGAGPGTSHFLPSPFTFF